MASKDKIKSKLRTEESDEDVDLSFIANSDLSISEEGDGFLGGSVI